MRFQLLLSFTLIIVIIVGISWLLAVKTTGNQFAVMVSENNQRQANFLAPLLVNEYERLGSWGEVQGEFDKQVDLENVWGGGTIAYTAPIPMAGSGGTNIEQGSGVGWINENLLIDADKLPSDIWGYRLSSAGWPGFVLRSSVNSSLNEYGVSISPDGMSVINLEAPNTVAIRTADSFIVSDLPPEIPATDVRPPVLEFDLNRGVSGNFVEAVSDFHPMLGRMEIYSFEGNMALVTESSSISWVSVLTRQDNRRAVVIDVNGRVVVDSGRTLIGKNADDNFIEGGIPLYANTTRIGTFAVINPNRIYTLEQNAFLEQVKTGLLYGGLTSAALALILAFMLSERITRPIRLLTGATARIQAGEWGYQVKGDTPLHHEIGQLNYAFNQMSTHLAEQRRLRGRLVDDLAHELNTPLSLMRLELQAMMDGMQSPVEAASNLSQELDEVAELVSDLIFLASRDASRSPRMDWIDLNDLLESILHRFEGRAGNEIRLEFEANTDLSPVYGDVDLIQRAVSNLVTNAIRYTPENGVITLKTRQHGTMVEVLVQDTGVGIAPEHLPHVFERFYRVDDSRNRESGGRGLGLSIVKQIMEQHQGDVLVESQAGKGSKFILKWPVEANASIS